MSVCSWGKASYSNNVGALAFGAETVRDSNGHKKSVFYSAADLKWVKSAAE